MSDLEEGSSAWLDWQYSPSRWSRRLSPSAAIDDHVNVLSTLSASARASAPASILDVPYAPGVTLDLIGPSAASLEPDGTDAPLVVYIHGGYWQFFSKAESTFLAPASVAMGHVFAAMDYTLCPGLTLEAQIEQVRASIRFLHDRFPRSPMSIIGHSAGAHLAAMVMLGDMPASLAAKLRHVCLVSGVFDVWPVSRTPSVNIDNLLGIHSEADALRCSPQSLLDSYTGSLPAASVALVWGEYDSPPFHAQAEKFKQTLEGRGVKVSDHVVKGKDHFNVMEDMAKVGDTAGDAFRTAAAGKN